MSEEAARETLKRTEESRARGERFDAGEYDARLGAGLRRAHERGDERVVELVGGWAEAGTMTLGADDAVVGEHLRLRWRDGELGAFAVMLDVWREIVTRERTRT